MNEEIIIGLLQERMCQLGYKRYHRRYRDLTIQGETTVSMGSQNELWFIIGDPEGLVVESDYGLYDSTGQYLADNIHQHRGIITVTNSNPEARRIKFIQAIIIN